MDVFELGLNVLYWILVILGWLFAVFGPLMLINKLYPITDQNDRFQSNVAVGVIAYLCICVVATVLFAVTKQSWISVYLALLGAIYCCVTEILDFAAKWRIRKLAQNILHAATTLFASVILGVILVVVVTFVI